MYKTINESYWKVTNPFRVITSVSVLDINESDEEVEKLGEEQDKILTDLRFDTYSKAYSINFGNRRKRNETIYDAIQSLALKDGADLVQFENGNYGYIGYYAGFNENWFEILGDYDESEDE